MQVRVMQCVQGNSDQHRQWILFHLFLLRQPSIEAVIAHVNVQLPDRGQGLRRGTATFILISEK